MKWQAFCKTCKKILDIENNEEWLLGVAQQHITGWSTVNREDELLIEGGTEHCRVIIGYVFLED